MPNKYNDKNRHKFKKANYKVTNWPEYNKALRHRGDFCLWFNEDAIANWCEPKENYSGIGRPKEYSEVAVQTSLFLRQLFHLPLRQTQGLMNSIINLMELPMKMMDYTNISKRSNGLNFERLIDDVKAGSHVIVDSSGLKVYGKDEWHQEKHHVKASRTWRKLHIAVDEKHQFIACELTTNDCGDTTALPALLGQVDNFDTFIADGAYDGEPSYHAISDKEANANIVIPPPKNAVKNNGNKTRSQHIDDIENLGRMGWQKKVNYGLRSYAELAIQRYRRIIGKTLKARKLPQQIAEAQASVRLINTMTQLGMPISVKVT